MNTRSACALPFFSVLILAATFAGCSALPPHATPTAAAVAESPVPPAPQIDAIFDGRTGTRLDWTAVIDRLAAAEIVLVGEQHDNVAGHHLEAALTGALLRRQPRAAVALEMFERHEQGLVDLYLDGRLAAPTLMTLTESENWGGGQNTWMDWYQPIVDHVKAHRAAGAALVAANSPRAYVKLARLAGFGTLALLPAGERTLFALPDPTVDDAAYRERFFGTMRQHSAPGATAPAAAERKPAPPVRKISNLRSEQIRTRKALRETSAPNREAAGPVAPRMAADPATFFRAQQVWDATMAESVARAHERHPQVVLFVGEFHLAHVGGTYLRIRHALPAAQIATVSILRSATPESFDPADTARADLVIYTPEP